MSITSLLEKDHKQVAAILKILEETTERALRTRTEGFEKLKAMLEAHAAAEEEVLYAPLKAQAKDKGLVLEAFEEHHSIRALLAELSALPVDHERWLPKLTVLKEAIEHHVEEEEGDLFAQVRKAFGEKELVELGDRFLARKTQLLGLAKAVSPLKSERLVA
jgi:hemerythrin-like domain-containing protein